MFPKISDKNLHVFLRIVSGTTILLVILISTFVLKESWQALSHEPLRFISDPSWDPSSHFYNLLPMIAGSLLITLGAILIATPLGVVCGIYYQYLAPRWIALPLRSLIELLAGIPSVIYGFWGLVTLVPLLYHLAPPGANLLAGSLVLSIMILPTISIFFASGIKSIPPHVLASANALGLSQSTILSKIIIPSCRGSLINSVLISLGRALGETMAVLMVSGNIVQIPSSVFDPVRTLTSNIALEMAYALDEHRSALFMCGFVLLLTVAILSIVAHTFTPKKGSFHV